MDTVESLHKYLDDNPADAAARCALGDLLTESGDPRGPGIAALGRLGKWPYQRVSGFNWCFVYSRSATCARPEASWGRFGYPVKAFAVQECWVLPKLWAEMAAESANLFVGPVFRGRRETEDWAADLFAKLPQSSQDLILAGDLVYRD
jgi:hypothetical protein